MHLRLNQQKKVKLELEHLSIKDVEVPKNMIDLFQPLDLTTNLENVEEDVAT